MAAKKKKKRKYKTHAGLELTEELIDEAVEMAIKGNFRYRIAEMLKINKLTWNSWLDRGRQHLRELHKGTRKEMTLQAHLVLEMDAADSQALEKITTNVIKNGTPRDQIAFAKMRWKRDFAPSIDTTDQETGEAKEQDLAEILAQKLSTFLGEE